MREKIAAVARRVFTEDGYGSVSMRRLAHEIGCTPMTLYTYYDGKIDILRDLWGAVFDDVFVAVKRAAKTGKTAAERLDAMCVAYVRYWLDHPEHYRMVFMSAGVSQSEVSVFVEADAVAAHYGVFFLALADAVARPPTEIAGHCEALICGLNGVAHNLITISGYPWSPSNTLVAILVEGTLLTARAEHRA